MKPLLIGLLLAATPAWAQDQAAGDPLPAALAQAQQRRTPLLVEFTAPWCYSCYYMAQHVLNGAEWDRARREAAVLELDADSPAGARYMEQWKVKAVPSYVVLDGSGQEQARLLGEQTRADFYAWLFAALARSTTFEVLKVQAQAEGEAALAAARDVLQAYHARYDAAAGLAWYLGLPPRTRARLARDASCATWIARLELQRAVAENDTAACAKAGSAVLAATLGCERPYELNKVLACTAGQPAEARRELLHPQTTFMQLLLDKRVFSDYRCADERSVVLGAADLHKALGDAASEALVLSRAVADLRTRIGDDLGKDRNLADNLRVYLDRAGRLDELDALFPQLIAAYPDDYVYAHRHGKSLAARGRHGEALPLFERAAALAYGVNKLRNAELRARSLHALGRGEEARQVLSEAVRDGGPWFPEETGKLRALIAELAPAAPGAAPN